MKNMLSFRFINHILIHLLTYTMMNMSILVFHYLLKDHNLPLVIFELFHLHTILNLLDTMAKHHLILFYIAMYTCGYLDLDNDSQNLSHLKHYIINKLSLLNVHNLPSCNISFDYNLIHILLDYMSVYILYYIHFTS